MSTAEAARCETLQTEDMNDGQIVEAHASSTRLREAEGNMCFLNDIL
jgi:hypothetical protein